MSTNVYLSPQQIISCDKMDGGCNGGWPSSAFDYVKSAGIELLTDYAYKSGTSGKSETCLYSKSKTVIGLTSYTQLSTETLIANYVLITGPMTMVVDTSTWSTYTGGILASCGTSIDHAVSVNGVDTINGYWIVSS